jgi:hypothetical protein
MRRDLQLEQISENSADLAKWVNINIPRPSRTGRCTEMFFPDQPEFRRFLPVWENAILRHNIRLPGRIRAAEHKKSPPDNARGALMMMTIDLLQQNL